MEKEAIISYILANSYLSKRAEYDMYNNPKLEINTLIKEKNQYHIKGVLNIELGTVSKEKNIFDCIINLEQNEINLKTKIYTINYFYNESIKQNHQSQIKGEPIIHYDTFYLKTINKKKYIIQLINKRNAKIYIAENNYSLKLVISSKIKNKEILETDIIELKKIIKRRIKKRR